MKAFDLIIPKSKVEFIYNDITVGEALKKIAKKRYAMIPVVERNSGRYIYSLAASDLLMKILKNNDIESTKKEFISSVPVDRLIVPCKKDTEIVDLADLAISQNFVPVVDNQGIFLGIVTRRAVIDYFISKDSEGE